MRVSLEVVLERGQARLFSTTNSATYDHTPPHPLKASCYGSNTLTNREKVIIS